MSVTGALEKLAKLAICRHTDGIPDHIICFDQQGDEVSWAEVLAASPKEKQELAEVVVPTPGTGYVCDIVLKKFNSNAEGETLTFQFRSSTFQQTIEFVQPSNGASYFKYGQISADAPTIAVLEAIDRKM